MESPTKNNGPASASLASASIAKREDTDDRDHGVIMYVGIEPLAIVIKPLTLAVYVRR